MMIYVGLQHIPSCPAPNTEEEPPPEWGPLCPGRVGGERAHCGWLEARPAARLLWQRCRVPAGVAEEPGGRICLSRSPASPAARGLTLGREAVEPADTHRLDCGGAGIPCVTWVYAPRFFVSSQQKFGVTDVEAPWQVAALRGQTVL